MLPTQIIELPSLPTSPSGKIDRAALEKLRIQANSPPLKESKTPIENTLFKIWSNLFNQNNFGTRDNFFDLGGHSILALQLISKIKQTFNLNLQIRNLFEYPDIERLAQFIEFLALGSQENIKKVANFQEKHNVDVINFFVYFIYIWPDFYDLKLSFNV